VTVSRHLELSAISGVGERLTNVEISIPFSKLSPARKPLKSLKGVSKSTKNSKASRNFLSGIKIHTSSYNHFNQIEEDSLAAAEEQETNRRGGRDQKRGKSPVKQPEEMGKTQR
jgi:hypothetical protein